MPSPHRIARARWPLTVIAVALLLVTIVTGWGGASYSWTGGIVNLGGGCVSGFYTDGSTVPPFLGQGWHVHFDWSDPPSWSHSVDSTIYGGTYRALVSLVPFVIVSGLSVAWAWYRYRRPLDRAGRPDRYGQFRRTRWFATALSSLLLVIAAGSYWFMFEFRNAKTSVLVVNGAAMAIHKAIPRPPSFPSGVPTGPATLPQTNVAPTLSMIGTRSTPRWGGTVYQFYWEEWPNWTHLLNLWFLWAVSLVPTVFLWFIHLRRYPGSSHCTACRYDRAGLGTFAPCPECGQIPRST